MISFTIPGPIVSNNRTTRNVGGRSIKSREAREYQERVRSLAWAAAHGVRVEGEKYRVEIVAWGQRLDVDNCAKSILDGMAGVIYENDRAVKDLRVIMAEGMPQRAVVKIEPIKEPL